MDFGLVLFAFSAGLVAFLNPCGFALLPSYVSYYLGVEENSYGLRQGVFKGVRLGSAVTAGFVLAFAAAGFVLTYVGRGLARYMPLVGVIVGVALVVLGLLVLFRPGYIYRSVGNPIALPSSRGFSSFFVFGIAYAAASLSCTLPIFLAVVLQAVSTGSLLEGVIIFVVYALGMGAAMLGVSVSVATSKNLIISKYKTLTYHFRTLSAFVLMAAGVYIIYFQLAGGLLAIGTP